MSGLTLAAMMLPPASGRAQGEGSIEAYPEKPVRLIVPYAPGGPTATLSRIVAKALAER